MPKTSSPYASRLGLGRIGLYGVSYGTKLAIAYALRTPAMPSSASCSTRSSCRPSRTLRPERSAGDAGHTDSVLRGRQSAAGHQNFGGDVVKLANRLEARPLQGQDHRDERQARDAAHERRRVDLDDDRRRSHPRARGGGSRRRARGAGRGSPTAAAAVRPRPGRTSSSPRISASASTPPRIALTVGSRGAPDTPPAARQAIMDAAVAALPPGNRRVRKLGGAHRQSLFLRAVAGPAGGAPLAPGPLPDVPVLAVNGGFDLRTPRRTLSTSSPTFRKAARSGPRRRPQRHVGRLLCALKQSEAGSSARLTPNHYACPRVPPLAKVLGAFSHVRPRPRRSRPSRLRQRPCGRPRPRGCSSPADATTMRGLYGGKLVRSPTTSTASP